MSAISTAATAASSTSSAEPYAPAFCHKFQYFNSASLDGFRVRSLAAASIAVAKIGVARAMLSEVLAAALHAGSTLDSNVADASPDAPLKIELVNHAEKPLPGFE